MEGKKSSSRNSQQYSSPQSLGSVNEIQKLAEKQPQIRTDEENVKNLEKELEEVAKDVIHSKEEEKPSVLKTIRYWVLKLTALVIAVGVVGLCLVSAVLSIMKLMETKDKPASTYQQKLHAGPHVAPGLIFLGEDIEMHFCGAFSFVSLNVDEQGNVTECAPHTIELSQKNSLSASVRNSLPRFLQDLEEIISLTLISGPSDWQSKDTVEVHFSLPDSKAGIWVIIHPDYEQIQKEFERVTLESVDSRWMLAADVILENSMNFVSAQFTSLFLMSKQEFKKFGVLEAVRIDMEISLIEQNETSLKERMTGERANGSYSHVDAFYQWKDGYYMEGDQFLAITVWSMVTIIASALLMLERGWNTLKRVLSFKISSRTQTLNKTEQEKIVQDLQREEDELNARQKAYEEAGPLDSRPSTGMSDVLMADDIDLEEEQLEEIEASIYGRHDLNDDEYDDEDDEDGPSQSREAWTEEKDEKEEESPVEV